MKLIGVLALQGGFAKHIAVLERLGATTCRIRTAEELSGCDGFIIPGGESTVLTKLLMKPGGGPAEGSPWVPGDLYKAIHTFAATKPVMGTCAGLIMLAKPCGDERVLPFDVLPVTVTRNAYGRQTESFVSNINLSLPDMDSTDQYPATFIRAPKIISVDTGVRILATHKTNSTEEPVMVQYGNIIGLSFHPELTPEDTRVHTYFLNLC